MSSQDLEVDVTIVGAGPVGLLLAYQLVRCDPSTRIHIVDKMEKQSPEAAYGRANVLFSRSAELLDQLDLADDMIQQCHVCREAYTYNAQGRRVVPGRVWNFVENIQDTLSVALG